MDELTHVKAKCFDLVEKNRLINLEVTNFVNSLSTIVELDLSGAKSLDEVLAILQEAKDEAAKAVESEK